MTEPDGVGGENAASNRSPFNRPALRAASLVAMWLVCGAAACGAAACGRFGYGLLPTSDESAGGEGVDTPPGGNAGAAGTGAVAGNAGLSGASGTSSTGGSTGAGGSGGEGGTAVEDTDGGMAGACSNGLQDGGELGIDCTGPCTENAQCGSGFCRAGVCVPHSCEDGALNGSESDVDCGGSDPRCERCDVGRACNGDGDCAGLPCVNGACFGCGNGQRDSNESDVDCGGACGACAPGRLCEADADCQSGACQDGRCCGGQGVDCTRCARRLARTSSCESSTDPVAVSNCNLFLDCLAQHPVECPVRYAQFCSADPGGVCNHTAFGGNGGPGLLLADTVIGTAACNF